MREWHWFNTAITDSVTLDVTAYMNDGPQSFPNVSAAARSWTCCALVEADCGNRSFLETNCPALRHALRGNVGMQTLSRDCLEARLARNRLCHEVYLLNPTIIIILFHVQVIPEPTALEASISAPISSRSRVDLPVDEIGLAVWSCADRVGKELAHPLSA